MGVEVQGRVIAATELALLVVIGEQQVWIPRSVVNDGDSVVADKQVVQTLEVRSWFAEKEGL